MEFRVKVRVKGDESKCFCIENGVKQGCIMSPWLFNEYVDAGMKEVKMEIGRIGMRFLEGERGVEIAWPLLCR